MKKIFLFLLLATVIQGLHAQRYIKLGYCANFYNMDQYDAMVDRYNVTRSWLTNKMTYMHRMMGPDVGYGARTESTGVEFYYRTAWATVTASGSPTGGPASTRYLKAQDSYFGLDMYVRIFGRCALSLAVEGSRFKTKTKVDDADYAITDKKMSVGITPGIRLFTTKGMFVPTIHAYYTLPFIKETHEGAWYTLDANNAASEPASSFRARASHFGISLSFCIGKTES